MNKSSSISKKELPEFHWDVQASPTSTEQFVYRIFKDRKIVLISKPFKSSLEATASAKHVVKLATADSRGYQ